MMIVGLSKLCMCAGLRYFDGFVHEKGGMVACANRPLEDCLPSFLLSFLPSMLLVSPSHLTLQRQLPTSQEKKKNCKGWHAFSCPLPIFSFSNECSPEVAIRAIHSMKLNVERGWMDRRTVVGCICGTGSWRFGRGEKGQIDTLREDTRSQWGLMISFDPHKWKENRGQTQLIGCCKMNPGSFIQARNSKHVVPGKKYKQWKDTHTHTHSIGLI